ncbi:hypothetical protein ACFQE0_07225 [Methylobacterium komagatae]|uniref:Uncharacterized protein n=1 Tax=Methylobacterium komagatae TaxID=374425 RepID=A0ABW2BGD9_9HYPH
MSDIFGKFDPKSGKRGSGDPLADLAEATRLTGLGRLEEATALIQRTLTGRGARRPRRRILNATGPRRPPACACGRWWRPWCAVSPPRC